MADGNSIQSALDRWAKLDEERRKSLERIGSWKRGLAGNWKAAAQLTSLGEETKKALDRQKSFSDLARQIVWPTALDVYSAGRAPETKRQPAPDLQVQQAAEIEKLEAELTQAVADRNQAVADRNQAYDLIAEIMIAEDGS